MYNVVLERCKCLLMYLSTTLVPLVVAREWILVYKMRKDDNTVKHSCNNIKQPTMTSYHLLTILYCVINYKILIIIISLSLLLFFPIQDPYTWFSSTAVTEIYWTTWSRTESTTTSLWLMLSTRTVSAAFTTTCSHGKTPGRNNRSE